MAISLDSATGKSDTANPVSWSHTTAAGSDRIMVITIQGTTSDIISGVTYAGATATRILYYTGSTGQHHWIYALLAPNTGANTVEISRSGATQVWAQSATFTGVGALPTISGGATNPGTATSLALALTSTVDNSWMVMASGIQRSPTASTGSTLMTDSGGDGSGKSFRNGPKTPAGSISMAVTFSSIAAGGMANSGVIIEPGTQAAAATGYPPTLLTLGVG